MPPTPAKLAKYQSMRDFGKTAEPSGQQITPRAGHQFVIQMHAATRLHYDFRLELDGVLLSWSVPKGPSLAPRTRRLAVRTEDHPIDYADFEGTIPKGQYGGGAVAVWDRGTWEPEGGDAAARAGLAAGRLSFTLHGEKLHGAWHLVRTKPQGKQESWLLFKSKDDAASDTLDIVATKPTSVLSGRTIDEIAAAPGRVWNSNRADGKGAKPSEPAPSVDLAPLLAQLPIDFKLTNLDKILDPTRGLTKGQLIAYFAVVAEHMLPHVAARPLTAVRCPSGSAKPCFFQKHLMPGSPAAIAPLAIDGEDYMQIHDQAGLIALAQLGSFELHTWGARADKIERPDLMVIDLDPDVGLAWDRVALAALELRRRLNELGLQSFVKTTGGKGLHVVVPFERRITWDELKTFSEGLCTQLARDEPAGYTTNMAKAQRAGKIFLDYLRNGRGATFVAPYSPRRRPNTPVAVPISWEELAAGVDPASFTIATVPPRIAALAVDPWAEMFTIKQSITAAARRAVGA